VKKESYDKAKDYFGLTKQAKCLEYYEQEYGQCCFNCKVTGLKGALHSDNGVFSADGTCDLCADKDKVKRQPFKDARVFLGVGKGKGLTKHAACLKYHEKENPAAGAALAELEGAEEAEHGPAVGSSGDARDGDGP